MVSQRMRSVCLTVLAGVLAGVLGVVGLLALAAGPATAAVEAPQIDLVNGVDNTALSFAPLVGQGFFAQSDQYYDVGNAQSTAWTCTVDFGDGSAPSGYFRGRFGSAPCASFHRYAAPGRYAITMTVTDPEGDSAQTTRIVRVRQRLTQVDGGVEGTPVTLTAPSGATHGTWFYDSSTQANAAIPVCTVSDPSGLSTTVRCSNQGTYSIFFLGDRAATSRRYDVTFVNGAPAPTIDRTDPGQRVGTGDIVLFVVDGHDPSYAQGSYGDPLTCTVDYGDGRTDSEPASGEECDFYTTFPTAGTYRPTFTVTDDSGASGTVHRRVTVVRRDVRVSSVGHQDDGLRGHVTGRLDPGGTSGAISLTLPDGSRVRAPEVGYLWVSPGSVVLRGFITWHGESGYFAEVRVYQDGPTAFDVAVYQGDDLTDLYAPQVARATADRSGFTTTYHAPPVS